MRFLSHPWGHFDKSSKKTLRESTLGERVKKEHFLGAETLVRAKGILSDAEKSLLTRHLKFLKKEKQTCRTCILKFTKSLG